MNSSEYRVLSFWSFNGTMADEEIIAQVRQFAQQGMGGFFMHARAGVTIPYFGEEWFRACETAILEAQRLGLQVWLYDEDGWPSGFGAGEIPKLGEAYQSKHLCFTYETPPARYTLAAWRETENGGYRRLPLQEAKKGDLYCYYGVLPHYVDLMNPDVTNQFIAQIHEGYKARFGQYFGTVIRGIFTDEPQLAGHSTYSVYLPKAFEEDWGQDLFDDLWLLYINGKGYQAFRTRFFETVTRLFTKNFTKRLADWCRKNGLLMTGHYSNEDGLCQQVKSNGNLMAHYQYCQQPGIDHLGRRLISCVALKQTCDAAALNGRDMTLSESFGCIGWDVRFQDLAWIAGWQCAFGVNRLVAHLSAYSMEGRRKRDYPAFFSYQEPWWEQFHVLQRYMEGLSARLSSGRRISDTLVIHPNSGMWCETTADMEYSAAARNISNQFRLLVENLLDLQVYFDLTHEELLNRFTIENDALVLDGQSYRYVVAAQTPSLRRETVALLSRFVQAGGKLIFTNETPYLTEGEPGFPLTGDVVCNRRGLWHKYLSARGYHRPVQVLDGEGRETARGLMTRVRKLGAEYLVYVFNPSRDSQRNLWLATEGNCQFARMTEENGQTQWLPAKRDGVRSYCPLTLNPMEGVLLRAQEGEKSIEAPALLERKRLSCTLQSLSEPNALNLDRCDCLLDGQLFLQDIYPIREADRVYRTAFDMKKDVKVVLRYTFLTRFTGEMPKVMTLVAEGEKLNQVVFNGQKVTDRRKDWWIDKSFLEYDISGLVLNGENTVELFFTIHKKDEFETVDGKFETERNRFYYPIEPESVYIRGDFDVVPRGEAGASPDCWKVAAQDFVLTDVSAKQPGDLTPQGLWFYRGNALYTGEFTVEPGRQVFLSLKKGNFTLAMAKVNGREAGSLYRQPMELDITDYTKPGQNALELQVFGSNRNLLGPHHHVKGNLHFVGPSTYNGSYGFENFVSPEIAGPSTWSEQYHFVPFSLGDVFIDCREMCHESDA